MVGLNAKALNPTSNVQREIHESAMSQFIIKADYYRYSRNDDWYAQYYKITHLSMTNKILLYFYTGYVILIKTSFNYLGRLHEYNYCWIRQCRSRIGLSAF